MVTRGWGRTYGRASHWEGIYESQLRDSPLYLHLLRLCLRNSRRHGATTIIIQCDSCGTRGSITQIFPAFFLDSFRSIKPLVTFVHSTLSQLQARCTEESFRHRSAPCSQPEQMKDFKGVTHRRQHMKIEKREVENSLQKYYLSRQ